MIRLGILGSTRGTHLLSLMNAITHQQLLAQITLVLSNKPDAMILERAKAWGLPAQFIDPQGLTREAYDEKLSQAFKAAKVDLILLIGYMRILSAPFIQQWEHKIINIHPSLLPAHAGLMDLAVHRAVLESLQPETGCTVHIVTETVDAGPIVLQKKCSVELNDTPDSLKARVQALEGEALVEAITQLGSKE